jgi:hypothetical protein
MFKAELWPSVVATAGSKRFAVERFHGGPRHRPKRDMDRRTFDDKELDVLSTKTNAAGLCQPPSEFRRRLHPERRQRLLVEVSASVESLTVTTT